MDGLTEGRIVHYVVPDGRSQGEHRPAIVVKVWNKDSGMINLQVFTDSSNDGGAYANPVVWRTSIGYSQEPLLNTWHWIEPA